MTEDFKDLIGLAAKQLEISNQLIKYIITLNGTGADIRDVVTSLKQYTSNANEIIEFLNNAIKE